MITSPISLRAILAMFALSALPVFLPALRAESSAAEKATWTKAADNKIYAQQLVNATMAANPDLLVIGMHGVKPGATESRMIASNLDRINKHDDDDDIGVSNEHKTICAPNLTETFKFEVLMPMKDASGKTLNAAIGFVFRYKTGDDEVKMHAKAVAIRDGLARQIPSFEALFNPIN
jgi:hypothetical protein